MKKKASLYTVLHRHNMWKPLLQHFIIALSSYPALMIEIFTRHKFGQRNFSLSSCISALGILLLLGVIFTGWQDMIGMLFGVRGRSFRQDGAEYFLLLFVIAGLVQAVRHKKEQSRFGRTVDFARYSRSNGEPYSYWYKLEKYLPNWITEKLPVNPENIWRYYEPFTAIAIGVVLLPIPFTRLLGVLLIICGLFYYWRTSIQYAGGYEYILDLIDEMIIAEASRDFMSPDVIEPNAYGVNVYAPMPDDPNLRERLMEKIQYDLEHPYDQEETPSLI